MVPEQLLVYIRQNIAAGFKKEEVAQALKNAGWAPQDIEQGFAALDNPALVEQKIQATTDAAEFARIQEELRRAQTRNSRFSETSPANAGNNIMAAWLIKKGIVKNEAQANMVLIGLSLVMLAFAAWRLL